jgi:hypothetical protein
MVGRVWCRSQNTSTHFGPPAGSLGLSSRCLSVWLAQTFTTVTGLSHWSSSQERSSSQRSPGQRCRRPYRTRVPNRDTHPALRWQESPCPWDQIQSITWSRRRGCHRPRRRTCLCAIRGKGRGRLRLRLRKDRESQGITAKTRWVLWLGGRHKRLVTPGGFAGDSAFELKKAGVYPSGIDTPASGQHGKFFHI